MRRSTSASRAVWVLLALVTAAPVTHGASPPAKYRRKRPQSALDLIGADAQSAPTTGPTSRATASRPTSADSPFGKPKTRPEYALPGVVIFSNGRKVPGYIWTPSGKEWRAYERASKQFRDIPFDVVKRIDGIVEWERMEADWRWKDGGMDVKVFTGQNGFSELATEDEHHRVVRRLPGSGVTFGGVADDPKGRLLGDHLDLLDLCGIGRDVRVLEQKIDQTLKRTR